MAPREEGVMFGPTPLLHACGARYTGAECIVPHPEPGRLPCVECGQCGFVARHQLEDGRVVIQSSKETQHTGDSAIRAALEAALLGGEYVPVEVLPLHGRSKKR